MDKSCDNCGNEYEHLFEVTIHGDRYQFDCFECAINKCAPRCAHCMTPIIGHGVESEKSYFCGAHCAREYGVVQLRDHVDRRLEEREAQDLPLSRSS